MKSIIHLYLYGMLKREVDGGNLIHISKIHPVIKWAVRLPHKYRVEIIKEMCDFGFLKKVGRDNYELLCVRIRPLSDSLGDPLW
jgi:hypothetical protein